MRAAIRPVPSNSPGRAAPSSRPPRPALDGLSPLQRLLAPEDQDRLAQLVADLDIDLSAELGGFAEILTGVPAEPASDTLSVEGLDAAPAALPEIAPAPDPGSEEAEAAHDIVDWEAAIQLIRDVGGRVRRARGDAESEARRARLAMQRSLAHAEAAEARLRAAEAATEAANLRVLEAEAAAQAAEARAIRAEEALRGAEAEKAEAKAWVRRLHASIRTEFEGLADDRPV